MCTGGSTRTAHTAQVREEGVDMKRMTVAATAVATVLLAIFTLNVGAQQPDTRDRTIMTFSGAVELPGMRLEPGKYVFRIADTAGRNVIQVLPEDEMEVLGQWLFVPAERQEVTGDTVVTFREVEASATTMPAVQYWFYPGEKIGKEFIYPKDQAMRIAQRTGTSVLTEDGRVDAPETAQASEPVASEAQPAPAAAPERTVAAEPVERPAATTGRDDQSTSSTDVRQQTTVASRNEYAQDALPRTAGFSALAGLIGMLALGGAMGIRTLRAL
jgi:hypothetical protein